MSRPVLRLVAQQGDPDYGSYVLIYMVPDGWCNINIGSHFEARFTGNMEETILRTTEVPRQLDKFMTPVSLDSEKYIAGHYELELDTAVARHFEIPKTIWLVTASKYVRRLFAARLRIGVWQDFRGLEYGSMRPDGTPMRWAWPVIDWWGLGFGGVIKPFRRLEDVHRERARSRSQEGAR
jgi:hypothetical protein